MSRDLVATRKLNDDRKAKLGRGGDTKIRKVDGKKVHVTALEASLIDSYGKAGEEFAKDVGSGTINPYTGLKEYYSGYGGIPGLVQGGIPDIPNMPIGGQDYGDNVPTGDLDYSQYHAIMQNEGDLGEYLYETFGSGTGTDAADVQSKFGMYFRDPSRGAGSADDPYDFLERSKDLSVKKARYDYTYGTKLAEEARDLSQDAASEALTTADETYLESKRQAKETYGLGASALGRTATRGGYATQTAGRAAQGKAGFAGHKGIAGQMGRQMRELASDYGAGQKGLKTARETSLRTAETDMDRAGRRYDTAWEAAERAYDLTTGDLKQQKEFDMTGTAIDYQSGVYGQREKEMDDFWDMIGSLAASGWTTPGS